MRKIREVLRLSALGLAQHQIARSCSIVQSTVHKYLKLAQAAKLAWPLPEDLSEHQLDELLFGSRTATPSRRIHPPPDFVAAHKELQNHKDLTLELLWQEYKQADPGGYGYSRFCDLYREWSRAQKLTLRQQHNPGEKLFVDYAGATIPIHKRDTGEVDQAAIFVAAMGFSSYTFAEATWSQQLPCWIGSHIRAFEYFGGLPMLVIPDNPKTGVSKACRYEPDLNPTYNDMAAHYGIAVLPARPRKPRDKAKVRLARVPSRLRNGLWLSRTSSSAMASFTSRRLKNVRLRKAATIQRCTTCTALSTLALSRGFLGRAGRTAMP